MAGFGRDALAIELTYQDGDQRLLMSHWRLADKDTGSAELIFEVEAKCGCRSNLARLYPCDRHASAKKFRVIDATAPQGRRLSVH